MICGVDDNDCYLNERKLLNIYLINTITRLEREPQSNLKLIFITFIGKFDTKHLL